MKLAQLECPLLAQSRHELLHCTCPLLLRRICLLLTQSGHDFLHLTERRRARPCTISRERLELEAVVPEEPGERAHENTTVWQRGPDSICRLSNGAKYQCADSAGRAHSYRKAETAIAAQRRAASQNSGRAGDCAQRPEDA